MTVFGSLADTTSAASGNSIPKGGKSVKYSAFNEEVARQLLDNSDILYVDPNKKKR